MLSRPGSARRLALRKATLGPNQHALDRARRGKSLVAVHRGAEAAPTLDECVQPAAGKAVDPRLLPGTIDVRLPHCARIKDAVGCRQAAKSLRNARISKRWWYNWNE